MTSRIGGNVPRPFVRPCWVLRHDGWWLRFQGPPGICARTKFWEITTTPDLNQLATKVNG